MTSHRFFSFYLPLITAVVYLVLAVASARYDDITIDEGPHLRYGIQVLKGNTERNLAGETRFRSTMPVTALNALPRAVEQVCYPGTNKSDWGASDIKRGRYVTMLCSLILLFYCFKFTASLGGEKAACIVMLLVACDPNILAHARLVTTDLYATTAFIATIYHLWQWLEKNKARHFYYWCIAIAVAQCCKLNNLLLYPVCLIPLVVYSFNKTAGWQPGRVLNRVFVFVVLQVGIINALFLFAAPWGLPLADMHLQSDFFKALQPTWLGHVPLPFPSAYTATFDLVQYERETFDGTALNYLLGETRYKEGFWNYYIVCYLLKTPFISIVLGLAAIAYSLTVKNVRKNFLLYCCWPCLFILLFLSRSSVQNGYRYLLPVVCLLFIFAGWVLEYAVRKLPGNVVVCLTSVPLLTAGLAFPRYISYTNMLITDKKMAYHYFADSNLNWGQRHKQVQTFMAAHPGYIFEPEHPCTGMLVIDLNNLLGLRAGMQGKFGWLRNHYKPVAAIDDCYLVFDVRQLPAGY